MNATSKYYSEPPLSAGRITAGVSLQPLSRSPTRVEVVLFCAAIRNFHRLHYDDAYCQEQGISGVIVPGFLMGNWCLEAVSRSLGPGWRIHKLKFRNTGLAYIGDTFTIGGEVTSVLPHERTSTVVLCTAAETNADGEIVTTAEVRAISE